MGLCPKPRRGVVTPRTPRQASADGEPGEALGSPSAEGLVFAGATEKAPPQSGNGDEESWTLVPLSWVPSQFASHAPRQRRPPFPGTESWTLRPARARKQQCGVRGVATPRRGLGQSPISPRGSGSQKGVRGSANVFKEGRCRFGLRGRRLLRRRAPSWRRCRRVSWLRRETRRRRGGRRA